MTGPTPLRSARYTGDFSEYCQKHLPGDFHYLDGDEVLLRYSGQPIVTANVSGILRFIESKRPGEEIRRSQRDVFPLLAAVIDTAIEARIVKPGSGVFVIEGYMPWDDGATVRQVRPGARTAGLQYRAENHLDRPAIDLFLRCRDVDLWH